MPSSLLAVQVDGSLEAWACILTRLYPLYPKPALTLASAFAMLPVAHKWVWTGYGGRVMGKEREDGRRFIQHLSFSIMLPLTLPGTISFRSWARSWRSSQQSSRGL